MTELLTFEEGLAVLDELGLRLADPGLHASALGRPAAMIFGQDAYPDLATKTAALLESVLRNHALVDGNKRAGWTLALVTVWLNGHEIDDDEDEAFAMVMSVAEGRITLADIADWFGTRMRPAS